MPELRPPRRFDCPLPDYPSAYIVLPGKWLGKHWLRRDEAVKLGEKYRHPDFTRLVITLALADEFSLPGLEGPPQAWDLEQVHLDVLQWLLQVVYAEVAVSFAECFTIPKASSPP